MKQTRWAVVVFTATCLVLALPTLATNQESVLVHRDGSGLSFDAQIPNAGAALSLSGPDGFHFNRTFAQGETLYISVNDDTFGSLPDGQYSYELTLTPHIDAATRAAMDRARATGDEDIVKSLRAQGKIPTEAAVAYGYFTVLGGGIVSDLETEAEGLGTTSGDASTGGAGLENVSAADVVHLDDTIVVGSLCVGFDCVNGESFGFDTIRMKENNLRLHFDDTSNSASFPQNDWRIVANDTSNGGVSYLGFEDSTAGRIPFRVEAGARNNALYVESDGDVGIGTNNPVTDLEIVTGNTPTMRLQQDGSSGFTPQTWDLAGNEAGFFIRDVTNGSALSFRILPGSGTNNALVITSDGDIGIGKATADFKLDVAGSGNFAGSVGIGTTSTGPALNVVSNRTGSDSRLIVEEQMALNVAIMAHVKSNGRGQIVMEDTSADGDIWRFRTVERSFNIDAEGGAGNELTINSINGDVTALGTFVNGSSRHIKTNIEEVDPQAVLDKVAALPVSTWSYKTTTGEKHMGPMAQDWHAAFGLGSSDTTISTTDTAGVALAAIKALNLQLQQKQQEIDLLKLRLDALEQKASD